MRLSTAPALLLLLMLSGCRDTPEPLSIHDLLADAHRNDGTMVRISGCYLPGGATHYLTDCEEPGSDFTLLIDDYDVARLTAATGSHPEPQPILLRQAIAPKQQRMVRSLFALHGRPLAHVVLTGQFQMRLQAFGPAHLDWRLILHQVVACDRCAP